MLHLLRYTNDNPGSLGGIQKGKSIVPKLEEIAEQVGLNKEETEILVIFWTLLRGAYNDTLNSTLNVAEHVRNTLSSPKIDYLNQLALGLTWLKKNGIRFSDLKTSNIMEKNNEVAIIDIGYSSVSQKKQIPSIEDLLRERETLDPEIINMIENAVEMPIKNISIKEGGTVLVQLVEEHDTKTMKEINEHWQKSEKYEEIKNMGYKVVLISNDDNNNLGTSITRELL
jgi:serine/threonine protein kinase